MAGVRNKAGPGSLPERGRDRYLGGVASGMAQVVDLDPFVVRVAFVLAAVYMPFVIVLYALAWLWLRDERTHRSLLSGLREPGGWRPVVGVSALALGAALLAPDLGPDGDTGVRVGVVLFGLGVLLVTAGSRRLAGEAEDTDDETDAGTDTDAEDVGGTRGGSPLVAWPPRARRQRRPPSHLGWLGISALVVLVGILAAVDQAWEPVKPGVAVSLCLLLLGAILLLATWRGRARMLLPLGLALVPLWAGFAVVDVARYDHDGDRSYRFGADDSVPPELTHGYGNMEVDLLDATFEDGQHRRLRLGLTGGRVEVDVPRHVRLRIEGDVGFGTVNIHEGGWDVHTEGPLFPGGVDMVLGSAGPQQNPFHLALVLDVGMGVVEVNRV